MNSRVTIISTLSLILLSSFCHNCSSSGANNANLTSLEVSSGTLTPAFDKDTLTYSVKVPINITSLTFKPTAESEENALITINELPVISGNDSAPILIYPGTNTVTIVVKSPDRNTERTYTITVLVMINELSSILRGSDTGNSDRFGWSIACDGTTLVIGAPNASSGTGPGAVYVFTKGSSGWVQEQKLTSSDGANGDLFGWSVAVSGNSIAVGAPHQDDGIHTDNGAAYVFIKSGSTWSQQGTAIYSNTPTTDYYFGWSVSLYGDTLAVGEPNYLTGYFGSAHIFTRSGAVWSHRKQITASDSIGNSYFGEALSLYSGTLAVGAKGDNNIGAVYIFTGAANSWTEQDKLTALPPSAFSSFGSSVSLYGTKLVIGSETESTNKVNSGGVYLFSGSGNSWSQSGGLIKSSSPQTNEYFGRSVSLYDNVFATGASGPPLPAFQKGYVSAFGKQELFVWSEMQDPLIPSGAEATQARFGQSVVVTDSEIIIGADFYDGDGSGAVYVYN